MPAKDHCVCYSQQATRLDVPKSVCLSIIEEGWFDYTREEVKPDERMANQEGGRFDSRPVYQPVGSGPHVVLIRQTPISRLKSSF
jgi:hypothetical protein